MKARREVKTMKDDLVSNNVTLTRLRGLLRAAKKVVGDNEAVHIELSLWHYDNSVQQSRIKEGIGVYRSGTKEGTSRFKTLEEAREYIKGWKEEEDANATS